VYNFINLQPPAVNLRRNQPGHARALTTPSLRLYEFSRFATIDVVREVEGLGGCRAHISLLVKLKKPSSIGCVPHLLGIGRSIGFLIPPVLNAHHTEAKDLDDTSLQPLLLAMPIEQISLQTVSTGRTKVHLLPPEDGSLARPLPLSPPILMLPTILHLRASSCPMRILCPSSCVRLVQHLPTRQRDERSLRSGYDPRTGQYHLFYQRNPDSHVWNNISW
jgi:hypothetical protein